MSVREDVWPQLSDYNKAIRDPPTAFQNWPELAGGSVRSGPIPGMPWAASGANAIVFSIRTTAGHQIAVRCFTRHPPNDVDERYRALGSFLAARPCPVFAGFQWTDHAIVVAGKRWPVLQMEWIDGQSLKKFVSERSTNRNEITQLSETWHEVVSSLEGRAIAHGDLQHGNIIVSSPTTFRLVDLDEVYCPDTERFGTNESGLPAYQHPQRATSGAWGRHIDRFSSIVIYTSLRAIASAHDPKTLLSEGDALVLSADDIKAAARENAQDQAWEFLLKSPEHEVRRLGAHLHEACRMRIDEVPSLDDLVSSIRRAEGATKLNNWPTPDATTMKVENRWGADAALADGTVRRSRTEPTAQQWTENVAAAQPRQRAAPQAQTQTWSGGKAAPRPKAARSTTGSVPAGARSTPSRAPASGSSRAAGWLAIVVGVLIAVLGAAFVVYDYAVGAAACDASFSSDCPEKGSLAFWGIAAAVGGLSLAGWGRQKAKR